MYNLRRGTRDFEAAASTVTRRPRIETPAAGSSCVRVSPLRRPVGDHSDIHSHPARHLRPAAMSRRRPKVRGGTGGGSGLLDSNLFPRK